MSSMHTLSSNPRPELSNFNRTEQGTPEWWKQRSNIFSGSKIANLCSLKNAEERQAYYEEVFGLRPRKPLDAEAMKRVNFGKTHEIDGVRNAIARCQGMQMWEVGFEKHPQPLHATWFGSSPDGVVFWPEMNRETPWAALEIKCSTKMTNGRNIPHSGIPYYYIGQLHAEMKCMPLPSACTWSVFVSWSKTKCKMWTVQFSPAYWNILWDLACDFSCNDTTWESFAAKQKTFVDASKQICRQATPLHPRGGFDTIQFE